MSWQAPFAPENKNLVNLVFLVQRIILPCSIHVTRLVNVNTFIEGLFNFESILNLNSISFLKVESFISFKLEVCVMISMMPTFLSTAPYLIGQSNYWTEQNPHRILRAQESQVSDKWKGIKLVFLWGSNRWFS